MIEFFQSARVGAKWIVPLLLVFLLRRGSKLCVFGLGLMWTKHVIGLDLGLVTFIYYPQDLESAKSRRVFHIGAIPIFRPEGHIRFKYNWTFYGKERV